MTQVLTYQQNAERDSNNALPSLVSKVISFCASYVGPLRTVAGSGDVADSRYRKNY